MTKGLKFTAERHRILEVVFSLHRHFDFDELYDLETDPNEMVNLADSPAYEDTKRDLVKRMWRTALAEKDIISNPYATVAMAPWGPGIAMEQGNAN